MNEPTTKAAILTANEENRGVLGRSAGNEPLFIICGRDETSDYIVNAWANEVEGRALATGRLTPAVREKVAAARAVAREMAAWGAKKLPGTE